MIAFNCALGLQKFIIPFTSMRFILELDLQCDLGDIFGPRTLMVPAGKFVSISREDSN